MREFVDSSSIAGDGDAMRERIARDGFLFFRGLIDPAKLGEVRRDISYAIAAHRWLAPGSDPLDRLPGEVEHFEGRRNWWGGYRAIQSLESFHAIAHDESVTGTLARLFDEDVLVHPRKIARVIWPGDPKITTPSHQDFTHILGTVDFVTCWIPLADCPSSQGGLRILSGSPAGGLRRVEKATGAGGIRSVVDEDDENWSTVDYRLGDAVVFHALTVHGGVPNTSDRLRLSVDMRYQPASEPISTWSMAPHFYERFPNLPSWDEFTSGWSTKRWIEAPDAITVIDSPPGSPIPLNAGANGGRSRFVDTSSFVQLVERLRAAG